jgi:hypothetical protein
VKIKSSPAPGRHDLAGVRANNRTITAMKAIRERARGVWTDE